MPLAPRSSVLDDEITSATESALRDLDLRRGSDFDVAFVALERMSLTRAIRLLDETLIPRTANKDLAQSLLQMRTVLGEELSQANALAGIQSARP